MQKYGWFGVSLVATWILFNLPLRNNNQELPKETVIPGEQVIPKKELSKKPIIPEKELPKIIPAIHEQGRQHNMGNVNITGNHNTVINGDIHISHIHRNKKPVRERVIIKKSLDPCEVERIRHETRVETWKTLFN